jgi:hypothetical protein
MSATSERATEPPICSILVHEGLDDLLPRFQLLGSEEDNGAKHFVTLLAGADREREASFQARHPAHRRPEEVELRKPVQVLQKGR